jgi:hypothetical protein
LINFELKLLRCQRHSRRLELKNSLDPQQVPEKYGRETKMLNQPTKINSKTLLSMVLILLLSCSAALAAIPATKAQAYSADNPTFSYLVVTPQPAGVDQTVNVIFWLDKAPPLINSVDYYGWNFTVTITRPDGQTETKGPFESDSIGGWYCLYTPTQIGAYKFKVSFPDTTVVLGGPANPFMGLQPGTYHFQASESKTVELTVQSQKVEAWPETPLPTGYWSNPISAENHEWSKIAGNWLSNKGLALYTTAPNSAHILWTKPMSLGGIAAGDLGWGMNYYNGMLYEPKFTPPIIISGRVFYNLFPQGGGFGGGAIPGVACVDLRTGEEIWRRTDMPQISCGQTFDFEGQDGYGVRAYLWALSGSNLLMFDAFSGQLLTTVANTSASTGIFGFQPYNGPRGELLTYSMDPITNSLSLWNSTKAIMDPHAAQFSVNMWSPPVTVPSSNGIQWTVAEPPIPGGSPSVSFVDLADGVVVGEATITATMNGTNPTFVDVGYDSNTGQQLWTQTRTGYGWGFSGPAMPGLMGMKSANGEGVYSFFHKETMQWHAFDIKTGKALWSTESLNKFTNNDYSMYDWSGQIAYGKLYTTGYSGSVVAFDLATGNHLWTYDQGSSGLMTPFGSWPIINGLVVADNKIYIPTQEHTPNTPLFRGYRLICLDASSGQQQWAINGFFASWAIASGVFVGYSGYDNQAYAFGKGLSATTVTASAGVAGAVTIQGTVTDQSAGQTAIGVPAAGTPAISDNDMTAWMAYLYEQQPKPTDAKGVGLTVEVKDANGNIAYTGSATTDIIGHFTLSWTPSNPGTYTVTASFSGSNSYYASAGTTGIAVGSTTTQNTPQQAAASQLDIGIAAIAIILAIIIVAVLVLRRK